MTHVLQVVSELHPFTRGSLAEVAAGLARALARNSLAVTIVMPRYRTIDPDRHALARRLAPLVVRVGDASETVALYEGHLPGGLVTVFFLEHPLFDRPAPSGDGGGGEDPDGLRRAALLGRGALAVAQAFDRWPAVVHAHDAAGALAIAFARAGAAGSPPIPATVFTIHDATAVGPPASAAALAAVGLTDEGAESLLALGVGLADRVTTVSPSYARELVAAGGLAAVLQRRKDRLVGVTSGIDVEAWDPARDPHLTVRYDAEDRTGKAACKAALQREVGLPARAAVPLIGSIGRLAESRGAKLIIEAGEALAALEAQFVFLGRGERRFEDGLANLVRRYPAKFAVRTGDDDALAHRLAAGADFALVPALVEPCGQGQLIGQRYGTPPIVRAVASLDDTVVDYDDISRTGSGFKIGGPKPDNLLGTMRRALALYKRRDAWDALVAQIMRLDVGWTRSALRHRELYQQLIAGAGGSRGGDSARLQNLAPAPPV